MANFYQAAHTFSEYLLIPSLTEKNHIPENVSLTTPLVKFRKGEEPSPLGLNIPFTSAIMQAVSDHNMAMALAKCGGLSFIYVSQPIEQQTWMVREVKRFKAGFVVSDIQVVANKEFLEENPAAKRFFEVFTLPLGDINAQNTKMQNGEKSQEDIERHAQEWIAANQEKWNGWLDEARAAAK